MVPGNDRQVMPSLLSMKFCKYFSHVLIEELRLANKFGHQVHRLTNMSPVLVKLQQRPFALREQVFQGQCCVETGGMIERVDASKWYLHCWL